MITKLKHKLLNFIGRKLDSRINQYKLESKFSPAVQVSQRHLYHYYKKLAQDGNVPPLSETGYKVLSQFEEDGKIAFLFAVLGTKNKIFVDIGASDGVNSNCSNLVLNFGWHGLFIDGNETKINYGKKFYKKFPDPWDFPPKFICSMIKKENINEIIKKEGFSGEIDLLSVDIDGNDYWIWDALECIIPTVVIIETHVEFGLNNIVVPYDPNYVYPGKHPQYHGASPVAMVNLARKKGYRLVGANNMGFNLFFVRNGIGEKLVPEVTVESILKHPRYPDRFKLFEDIKDWKYLQG